MLAFVHIPKTAGTTLHKILSHQCRRTFIHHDYQGPVTTELAAAIREAKPQVIMGHLSVGMHALLPEVRYITCLRDPVARLVSHYHHALNDPEHYLHNAVVDGNMDMATYVASGLSGELSNGMTRMLAGVEDFHHAKIDETSLATAKQNLETLFDGVIISEAFDAGVLALAPKLGWSTPYYLRRKVGNYKPASICIDGHTRSIIEEINRLDCELYAWAAARIREQLKEIPGLDQQVANFRRQNQWLGKAVFCIRELRRRMCVGLSLTP